VMAWQARLWAKYELSHQLRFWVPLTYSLFCSKYLAALLNYWQDAAAVAFVGTSASYLLPRLISTLSPSVPKMLELSLSISSTASMLTLILPRVLSPNTLSKAAWQSGLLTPFLTSSCTIMLAEADNTGRFHFISFNTLQSGVWSQL